MKKNIKFKSLQKGQAALIIIIIVVVLLAAWYFLIFKKGTSQGLYQTIYPSASPTPSPVGYQNRTDLDSASAQLDSTNLNQMDAGINQTAADASSF